MSDHEAGSVTINALTAKRADIVFRLGELQKQMDRLQTELVHIDAVLRMFRPELKPEALPARLRRPIRSPYFAHGELTQRIYDAFRQAGGPIATTDVALAAMRDKGLDPDSDPATRADFVRRATTQLNYLVRKGEVEKLGRGRALRWRLNSAT